MKQFIQETVRETIEKEIKSIRNSTKPLSPEEFAEKVASIVASHLPEFTVESKREFDDPWDSYSTTIMKRLVTPWKDEYVYKRDYKIE